MSKPLADMTTAERSNMIALRRRRYALHIADTTPIPRSRRQYGDWIIINAALLAVIACVLKGIL